MLAPSGEGSTRVTCFGSQRHAGKRAYFNYLHFPSHTSEKKINEKYLG